MVSLQNIDRENVFSEADVRLLTTLAASMSVALENARLFEAERQRNAELAIITSVQQGLAAQLDMQAIFDLVGEKVRELFDAQVVSIETYDLEKGLDYANYYLEKGQRYFLEPEPLSRFSRYLVRHRQPLMLNENVEEILSSLGAELVEGTEVTKSVIFVPLLIGEQVRGVISLQNVDLENAFSESDLRLLTSMAERCPGKRPPVRRDEPLIGRDSQAQYRTDHC
jgi:GAF domain-containing protein